MITVLYFAWVRERIGVPQERVETSAATIAELVQELSAREDRYALAFSDLPALRVDLPRGESRLRLETVGGAAALDRVLLTAASPELSGRPEESHGTSGP